MKSVVKKQILFVRVPNATKRRLERKAKSEDLHVSKVVTRLLDNAMDEEDEKQRSDEFADRTKDE